MDILHSRTVTVFNRIVSDDVLGGDDWQATVLKGVGIREAQGANITKSGLADASSATVYIRTDQLEKPYVDPIEWDDMLDKTGAFTFHKEHDFFVIGDASAVVPTTDDFFNYMKANYDGVYRVSTVDKYELIPHLEVGGK